MILFCEECGRRNEPGADCIAGCMIRGRAVFACDACGYHNNYRVPDRKQLGKQQMATHLFDTIVRAPMMVGGFIYDIREGITCARMPDMLLPEDLHSLGWRLARAFDKGITAMPDICSMTVLIADKYFFVARKENGQYLILAALTPMLPQPVLRVFHQWSQDVNHDK